jgi:hypothetical protein
MWNHQPSLGAYLRDSGIAISNPIYIEHPNSLVEKVMKQTLKSGLFQKIGELPISAQLEKEIMSHDGRELTQT